MIIIFSQPTFLWGFVSYPQPTDVESKATQYVMLIKSSHLFKSFQDLFFFLQFVPL